MSAVRAGRALLFVGVAVAVGSAACSRTAAPVAAAPASGAALVCQNDQVAITKTITIVAPHPDDETLGFAGVIRAGLTQGSKVRVVITTDGQGFCQACALWKLGRMPRESEQTGLCTLADLAAMGAERRRESGRAMALLGVPAEGVRFLGFLDGSLTTAWKDADATLEPLRCMASDTSASPWPATHGRDLRRILRELLAEDASGGSVFTTHAMDGHPDHAALYRFVHEAAAATGHADVYAAVIHDRRLTDCGYPTPAAPSCWSQMGLRPEPDRPALFAENERARSRFDSWWMPDLEAGYGPPLTFCTEPALWSGPHPRKAQAIDEYRSQRGTFDQSGKAIDPHYAKWVDAEGYLPAFVRRNEIFYRNPPATP